MKKYYLIVVEGSQEVKKLRPSRKKIVSWKMKMCKRFIFHIKSLTFPLTTIPLPLWNDDFSSGYDEKAFLGPNMLIWVQTPRPPEMKIINKEIFVWSLRLQQSHDSYQMIILLKICTKTYFGVWMPKYGNLAQTYEKNLQKIINTCVGCNPFTFKEPSTTFKL